MAEIQTMIKYGPACQCAQKSGTPPPNSPFPQGICKPNVK